MTGFDAAGKVLRPNTPISDADRDLLKRVAASIALGLTPEDISAALKSGAGFPVEVEEYLGREHAEAELSDYVDVVLHVIQTPKA